MFGIDATEFILIIVLAIVLFGPERIPQLSRKAARVFVYLRGVANTAQSQLRDELGPEYADLKLTDLNPKTFVRKHLSNEIAAIEEAKAELNRTAEDLKSASSDASALLAEAKTELQEPLEPVVVGAPFDPEAT